MTTRCYEELQAKLENQELPPLFSRETTECVKQQNIIYYDKNNIPEQYHLPIITDWNTFDATLHSVDTLTDNAYQNALNILASDTAALSIAASDLAEKQTAYYEIVASDNNVIFTQNFIIESEFDISSSDAQIAKEAYDQAIITSSDAIQNFTASFKNIATASLLSANKIHKGETISIYMENNILMGRIYRNVQGDFIKGDFSQFYPFTIEKIESYKIDEKLKAHKNNYLGSQLTKAQKWSKISKNTKIRKRRIFLTADKCSYPIVNDQTT